MNLVCLLIGYLFGGVVGIHLWVRVSHHKPLFVWCFFYGVVAAMIYQAIGRFS